ncbi:MAG: DUF1987 domain-containing protein [Cyclobacteriaceae bacterium]
MEAVNLENLEIQGEEGVFFIPKVYFDASTGKCIMEGEAFLENTWEFYEQLLNWLRSYMETNRPIVFDFRMSYFNTSSSKGILEMLILLKDYQEQGAEVQVSWYYQEKDVDILEEAQDFIEDTQLDMKLIAY